MRSLSRNWPLSWAVVYLAGFGLGGRLPAAAPPCPESLMPWFARASTLLPTLLALTPAAGSGPVWLGIMSGGFTVGALEADHRRRRVSAVADGPTAVARARVWRGPVVVRLTGWASPPMGERWRAPARLVQVGPPTADEDGLEPGRGQGIMLAGEGPPPTPGALVTGLLEISVPARATVPGAFDYRLFLAGRGLKWQGKFDRWRTVSAPDPVAWAGCNLLGPLRAGIVEDIGSFLPAREAGMAAAVLLGIRDQGSRATSRPFAELGLAHLFAVSGLHVGILLGIIVLPARWCGLSPGGRLLPVLFLLPVYVLLTGLPGSVVRAAGLGLLAMVGAGLGRPVQALRVIGLLFWAGTVWDPMQNLDAGLKLSYLAAGGILGVSALTNGLRFSTNRLVGPVMSGLGVSAAAQWFTLPLVAGSFGRISTLSLAANLLAVPLFGLAVWGVVLSLVAGSVWPAAGETLGALSWLLFRILGGMAAFLARTTSGYPIGLPPPGPERILIWAGLTMTVLSSFRLFMTGRLKRTAVIAVTALSISLGILIFGPLAWGPGAGGRVTAWQFDVGQGDCALVTFPDGWSLLIDAGGTFGFGGDAPDGPVTRAVLPFLLRNGISSLDGVILTHGHRDHTGGARALAEGLNVKAWYVSGRAGESLAGLPDTNRIHRPLTGRVLHRWGDWEVLVSYPDGHLEDHLDENDHSLVMTLALAGKALAVWSGDLEVDGERAMVAGANAPGGVQVWKAGHHGSDTSGCAEFLEVLRPRLILISCGVGNGYRHPSHGPYVTGGDTVPTARTDLQGTILLEWDGDGVLTWRPTGEDPRKIGLP